MNVERVRLSDTVTRYHVVADVPAHSTLMLVRPEDGLIVTGWTAGPSPLQLAGQWVSPYPDLVALLRTPQSERAATELVA